MTMKGGHKWGRQHWSIVFVVLTERKTLTIKNTVVVIWNFCSHLLGYF